MKPMRILAKKIVRINPFKTTEVKQRLKAAQGAFAQAKQLLV